MKSSPRFPDAITSPSGPARDFGAPLPLQEEAKVAEVMRSDCENSRTTIEEMWSIKLPTEHRALMKALDDEVRLMREVKYEPSKKRGLEYVTWFGFMLMHALYELAPGATLIRRSVDNIFHHSLRWDDVGHEVFPFHIAKKALLDGDVGTTFDYALQGTIGGLELMRKKKTRGT